MVIYVNELMEIKTQSPCPVCGESLYYIFYETKIAYEEEISIETYFCKRCLYKSNKISSQAGNEPKKINVTIQSREDLRIIIYRSSNGRLIIPEFGAEIEPGLESYGEITTVEAVLEKFLDKIDFMGKDEKNSEIFDEKREKILRNLKGDTEPFTVIIEDPSGKSRINSSKAIESSMEN